MVIKALVLDLVFCAFRAYLLDGLELYRDHLTNRNVNALYFKQLDLNRKSFVFLEDLLKLTLCNRVELSVAQDFFELCDFKCRYFFQVTYQCGAFFLAEVGVHRCSCPQWERVRLFYHHLRS